jgi:acetolactate synthase I/II/III large subunit
MRFINTHGLGSMGFGVPAALGACLASGGGARCASTATAGFPMNAQELAAICARSASRSSSLSSTTRGYGSIRATQINYFNSRFVACDAASGLAFPEARGRLAESERAWPSCRIESQADRPRG